MGDPPPARQVANNTYLRRLILDQLVETVTPLTQDDRRQLLPLLTIDSGFFLDVVQKLYRQVPRRDATPLITGLEAMWACKSLTPERINLYRNSMQIVHVMRPDSITTLDFPAFKVKYPNLTRLHVDVLNPLGPFEMQWMFEASASSTEGLLDTLSLILKPREDFDRDMGTILLEELGKYSGPHVNLISITGSADGSHASFLTTLFTSQIPRINCASLRHMTVDGVMATLADLAALPQGSPGLEAIRLDLVRPVTEASFVSILKKYPHLTDLQITYYRQLQWPLSLDRTLHLISSHLPNLRKLEIPLDRTLELREIHPDDCLPITCEGNSPVYAFLSDLTIRLVARDHQQEGEPPKAWEPIEYPEDWPEDLDEPRPELSVAEWLNRRLCRLVGLECRVTVGNSCGMFEENGGFWGTAADAWDGGMERQLRHEREKVERKWRFHVEKARKERQRHLCKKNGLLSMD